MACPWFYPVERLGAGGSVMPLGDIWNGHCRAPGSGEFAPDRRALIDCCNLGYARGRCRCFPPGGAGPDAQRFAVTRHIGDAVTVCCVSEKDYLPFARASLDFDTACGRFNAQVADPLLERQARAYITSFILRKQTA